jgi:serine/threonine-protein kinase
MRLAQGERIGDRYTLVSRLGSGGMADVWLADDGKLGRRVALKFLHESFSRDTSFVERFRREASSAAGLQHPNIVGVYDRGDADGRYWIAMEYVEGAALSDLISRGLSIGEAVEIIRQVLAGARFAHEHGIVHRDLKPQNVLVDGEGRARVTDFGIARAGVSEITQTGSVLGTAQYLSPEQAQGLEVTAAADIYSVGVMLYEALCGRVPFEAESPVAVALKQVSEQPQPPSQSNPKVSPALDAVVLKALAKEPENRFASAAEFSAALDAAEADPSGGALGQTAAYTALAPVAVVAADEPLEEEEEQGWLTRRRAILLAALALVAAGIAIFALTRSDPVKVPAVIEQDVDEARSLLERRGFDVALSTVENCAAEDTVIEQEPPAGSDAEEGSRVTLTVSLGQSVRIPALRNVPLDEAREQLEDDQLLVRTVERPSTTVDQGRVIASDPQAEEEAECGSTVTLTVSKGPNLVTLPNFLGEQQEFAQSELRRLGLIPNVETRDDDADEGTVIGQDPGPESTLRRGQEVTIIVSTGAGSVLMPSVEGRSQQAAIDTLTARGLGVDVQVRETEFADEDDRVLDQSPASGTRLRAGDTVTIVVGEYTPPPETTTTQTTTTEETDPTDAEQVP